MFADQRHWEIQNHSVSTYGNMLYSLMCTEPCFLVMYATEWFGCVLQSFIWQIIRKQKSLRTWRMKVLCSKGCTSYRPLACGALSLFIMCYHMVVCNCVWSQEGEVLSSLRWAPLVNPLAGLTQLPAHQSLSFLACVPFCVEQIPNFTVSKNHYFWKQVVLIISIDRPVDLLPLDTSHWIIFINVCMHFILRRSDLIAGEMFWRMSQTTRQ